jgi:hypothetical protein
MDIERAYPVWRSVTLSGVTSVTVTHNLSYRPTIKVVDGATNQEVDFVTTHLSVNQFKADFGAAVTGTLYYR